MNKILFFASAISILIISGCTNGNKNHAITGGFTINGTIKSMDSGWVYLQHDDSTALVDDSVKIINHSFTFTGKVPEPTLYHFWAGKEPFYIGHSGRKYINSNSLVFFVEDTTIQINIQDTVNKAIVSGSHANDVYVAYKKSMTPFDLREHILDSCYDKADKDKNKAVIDSLYKLSDQLDKDENAAIASYAESNPNCIISAWAVTNHMLYEPNAELLKKVYASFSPSVQQSSYGRKIKNAMDITESVSVGQQAPDFTQNDTAGKPVSLSSFRGKYVLLDFWASWCPDCRRENPNVVSAYKKYKDKNFTVLGVSLDSKKQPWVKTIHDEELKWTQVSDLKLWNNAVTTMYGIKSIPANFLIDPEGKVIGHNLMGRDLDKILAKVLE